MGSSLSVGKSSHQTNGVDKYRSTLTEIQKDSRQTYIVNKEASCNYLKEIIAIQDELKHKITYIEWCEKAIYKLKWELKTNLDEKNKYKLALEERIKEINSQRDVIERLKQDVTANLRATQNLNCEEKIDTLKKQLRTNQNEQINYKFTLEKLNNEIYDQKTVIENYQISHLDFKKTVDKLQATQNSTRAKLAAAYKELDKLKNKTTCTEQCKAEIDTLKAQLKTKENEKDEYKLAIEKRNAEIIAQKSVIKGYEKSYLAYKTTASNLHSTQKSTRSELTAAYKKIEHLEATIDTLKKTEAHDLDGANEELEALRDTNRALAENARALRSEVDELKKYKSMLTVERKRHQEQLKIAQERNDLQKEKCESLTSQFDELRGLNNFKGATEKGVLKLHVKNDFGSEERADDESDDEARNEFAAIIFNMKENELHYDDILCVERYLKALTGKSIYCNGVSRLGYPKDRPRPIKVFLQSKADLDDVILSRRKSLNLDDYQKVSVDKFRPKRSRQKSQMRRAGSKIDLLD